MLLLVHAILTLWVSWARGQEFTCEPPVIPNGDFAPKMDQYELDYVITYQCGNGFHPPLRGNEAECTALGWLPLPRCVRKPCGFPEIKHGRLLHADTSKSHFPVYEGRSLAYFCDYGYVPPSQAGLGVLTCTQDGWSPDIPCLRKCSFKSLRHGYAPDSEERYVQGQSRTVMCHRGYGLPNPQNTMTCAENGWSPPPKCIRHCDMPIFENARATFTGKPFRPNDTMDYQCLDGYENRDGSTNGSMVCGEDGWSHLPTCFKSADKCGPPPEISNGDIASFPLKAYPPWSRVEYQCQAYYELQGPTDVTCSYGKWSKPPRCIEPCIVSKENLDGKNIRLKGSNDKTYYAKSGHILEFVCKSGRKAVTSARSFRALCLEGAVELPRCE
ncbi:complement factor H-related protein 4 isoform X2 [Pipistrellus kuhlii]|uniref:complement factor H-related protein 4 isoform X2 n=1 Tax=Pipistrellus kuhlii TaxID=59472 RepID=UPI001E2700B1|nr:complement factor H-related protein 4 isoform X2 [Pipistrellus kuhlii]